MFVSFCCYHGALNDNGKDSKPNLLYIIDDQHRYDVLRRVQDELPDYENKIKVRTPNLDRLSWKGAYFRQAYCQSPVCAPARGTLRTGCTIERNGIQANDLVKQNTYQKIKVFETKINNSTAIDQVLAENGYNVEY